MNLELWATCPPSDLELIQAKFGGFLNLTREPFWWEALPFVQRVRSYTLEPNTGCWLWWGDSDCKVNERPIIKIGHRKINIKQVLFNIVNGLDHSGTVKSICKKDCIFPLHLYAPGVKVKKPEGDWGQGIIPCLGCGSDFSTWSLINNRHCFRCHSKLSRDLPTEGENE